MRLALLALGALGLVPASVQASPVVPSGDPRPAAAAVNAFTADVLRSVAGSGGNAFLSPYSISVAMAMARAGARGETAAQMDAVLHLPPDPAASYRALVAVLASAPLTDDRTPAYSLSVANGLFCQRGFALEDAFRATIANDYGGEARELDFTRTEVARREINDWVASKTANRIRDVVPPGLPTPDTRLGLANAIHFKAAWHEAFFASRTTDKPFTVSAGRQVTVPTMGIVEDFGYGETPDARVLRIPYRYNAASMVVVLPKAVDGLDGLIAALTAERLEGYVSGLQTREVNVDMPKFSFTSAFDAKTMLQRLGIVAAFEEHADFSGISRKEPLLIGAVLHKGFVAVDEKGTEAAAATVVFPSPTASPEPAPEPVRFVVDHPFLFLIRHERSGAILFAGRVVDPTAS
jgi:serpin B